MNKRDKEVFIKILTYYTKPNNKIPKLYNIINKFFERMIYHDKRRAY